MICFRLEAQEDFFAALLALFKAGSSIEARIAMIAITTRSSIKVKFRFMALSPLGWLSICLNYTGERRPCQ